MPSLRMPAEWEPHAATWVAWPHNPETWPGCLDRAEEEFRILVTTLARHEPVRILVQDRAHARHVRAHLRRTAPAFPVELLELPTDDSWMRDIGPTFVEESAGGGLALDWRFNSWGGKYPPWDRDDAVAGRVAQLARLPGRRIELVVEGGALEVDGEGTLLATRSTLLGETRNPGLDEGALEQRLAGLLGVSRLIWLEGGIEGDDTDGHVDDIARFVAPGRVVCAVEPDRRDPNHAVLAACRARLAGTRDARGRILEVIDLPMPRRIEVDGARLPASYANFYLANGAVLIPGFADPADARAREILGGLLPGRVPHTIPCRMLVRGLGGIHCLTQQQPALRPGPPPPPPGPGPEGGRPGREARAAAHRSRRRGPAAGLPRSPRPPRDPGLSGGPRPRQPRRPAAGPGPAGTRTADPASGPAGSG